MKRIIIVFMFLVGLFSLSFLIFYIIGFFIYVFSDDVAYPGDIAFIPKWIFLLSPLALLARRKEVQDFLERFERFLGA